MSLMNVSASGDAAWSQLPTSSVLRNKPNASISYGMYFYWGVAEGNSERKVTFALAEAPAAETDAKFYSGIFAEQAIYSLNSDTVRFRFLPPTEFFTGTGDLSIDVATTPDCLNQWVFVAGSFDHTTDVRNLWVIKVSDGSIIASATSSSVVSGKPNSLNFAEVQRKFSDLSQGVGNDGWVAEFMVWEDAITQQEAIDVAQAGFAAKNTTGCALDINYMLPLEPVNGYNKTGTIDQVTLERVNDAGNYSAGFDTFNPVDVLTIESFTTDATSLNVESFSILTGSAKLVVYTTNVNRDPSTIWAETGSVASASVTFDGVNTVFTDVTGLSTDTVYYVSLVQDTGGGSYTAVQNEIMKTASLYSHNLVDVTGVARPTSSSLKWSWHSGTTADAANKVDGGTAEIQSNGLVEIGVTGSQSGNEGLMMLTLDDGGATKSTTHQATLT